MNYMLQIDEIYATPIWFCKTLGTKINNKLSIKGFNFIRDLFPENLLLTEEDINSMQLTNILKCQLVKIVSKVPTNWKGLAHKSKDLVTVILPRAHLYTNGVPHSLKNLKSKAIYNILILDKIVIPKGILSWCEELFLSNEVIESALTFSKECTRNIFKQVFQYKIITNILATKSYLKRYKIIDSDTCSRCFEESDCIVHCLWDCREIIEFLKTIFQQIKDWSNYPRSISMEEYLCGLFGADVDGINHFLIETKLFVFYSWKENEPPEARLARFYSIVRRVIMTEKKLAKTSIKYDIFAEKWKFFTEIYDFRGPDDLLF